MKNLTEKLMPVGHLVLRLAVGAVFLIHGMDKMNMVPGVVGMTTGLGFPAPEVFAWLLIITETVGGALLILGLFTRFAAIPMLFAMLVALFGVHFSKGFSMQGGGYEYVLVLSAALVLFMLEGAGKASLDEAIFKGKI